MSSNFFFDAFVNLIGPVATFLSLVCWWKIFVKAGQPGWASLVPIYNAITILKVAKKPTWWIALYLIPIVNVVIAILVIFDIGRSFGKSSLWSFFMLFILSVVGLAILAFGPDKYVYADGLPASVPEPSMEQAVDAPVGVVDETVSSFTTEAGLVSPEINPTSLGSTETLTDNQNNGDDKPTV